MRPISRLCKALGDETRLRIIALLAHGELCVCHIHDALELSQPNISRQLGILRAARLVEDRREGSWVYYRLLPQENADCERLLQGLVQAFAKQTVLRRYLARLVKVRGPGRSAVRSSASRSPTPCSADRSSRPRSTSAAGFPSS